MSVTLADVTYTASPLETYPTASNVLLTSTTTFGNLWQNGTWAEIHASTPAAWAIACVVPEAGVTSAFEIDLGTGGSGSQTVLATVPGSWGGAGPLSFQVPIEIPAGTHLWARFRHNFNFGTETMRVAIQYYTLPVTGSLTTSTTGPAITAGASDGLAVGSGASTWANGNWATVSASASGNWAINGVWVTEDFFIGILPSTIELEIGVGSPGSEVVLTTMRLRVWYGQGWTQFYRWWPILKGIQTGQRVACRVRSSRTGITYRVKFSYYASLPASSITTTDVSVPEPSGAAAVSVVTPTSSWTSGDWAPVLDPTATTTAVTTIIVETVSLAAQYEVDLGYAVSGAAPGTETVVSTIRWAQTLQTDLPNENNVLLRVAVTVPANSRVSLRSRSSSALGTTLTCSILTVPNPTFTQVSAGALQQVYIAATNSANPQKGSGSLTWSDWAELEEALSSDTLVSGIGYVTITGQILLIQLGTGAEGEETAITTVRPGEYSSGTINWVALPQLLLVSRAERLSVRFTTSSASTSTDSRFAATYYGTTEPPTPDPGTPTEMPIRWVIRSPHVSDTGQRFFFQKFQLDMETGIGNADGSLPKIALRTSDDGGFTWSSVRYMSVSKLGEYGFRVQIFQLGYSRDRIFEISSAERGSSGAIAQAWLTAEPEDS